MTDEVRFKMIDTKAKLEREAHLAEIEIAKLTSTVEGNKKAIEALDKLINGKPQIVWQACSSPFGGK